MVTSLVAGCGAGVVVVVVIVLVAGGAAILQAVNWLCL